MMSKFNTTTNNNSKKYNNSGIKIFFQNLENPKILEENKNQLQKQNGKMNPTVKYGEAKAENGLELRMSQNYDCAMKTLTCHDLNMPGGLLSSSNHDNPGVAGLGQEGRVAARWLDSRASHEPYFTKRSDLQIFCLETIEYSDLGSLLEHYFPMTDKGLPLIRV